MRQIIRVFLLFSAAAFGVATQNSSHAQGVFVDLLGYRTTDTKIGFLKGSLGDRFQVMDIVANKPVFEGKVRTVGKADENSGDTLYEMDFTQLTTPGKYQIWIPNASVASGEFTVASDVYGIASLASLQSFYYQRCGEEINNGTPWRHPACHQSDAAFYDNPSVTQNVSGGWHDAGDYGKFVSTGAFSAAFLLYLYEDQPAKFHDGQLSIPESRNGVPDILDEVRWELQWLLKMQGSDGGVFHKVSSKKWSGEHLPNRDPDRRYIFEVSSTATGSFAAVTALAARIYQKWDPAFAHQLLKASVEAWRFLQVHPSIVPPGGFQNPTDVEGGEYGDPQDDDERLWAAVELFRTTQSEEYHRYVLANYQRMGGINYPVSWEHVQNFAYYSYLNIPQKSTDPRVRMFIISTLTNYCEGLLKRVGASGYRYVLNHDQYYWGSNSLAMAYAYDLIQAYEVTGNERYQSGALEQLHYILGRNPMDQTFVTGVGSNPVMHPYHQFSMLLQAGRPVPGLIVGGANENGRLRGRVLSAYPAKCYEDNEKNYFVNEVAINYTAPFAFVTGYFSALGSQPDVPKVLGSRGAGGRP